MSTWFLGADVFSSVVTLTDVALRSEVRSVRRHFESEFGVDPVDRGGWYHEADWHRISFVMDALIPGRRFLDVGLGAGQFINAVASTSVFDEVHGADRSRFNKYLEFGGLIERVDASVAKLPYPDDHFDVVTCMEVLEHVPDEVLDPGLSELRRVCRGQLIMSVPFEEPEPIYEGHRRRFTAADVERYFPEATRVLLFRPLAPWAIVEEWHGATERVVGEPGLAGAARCHGRPLTRVSAVQLRARTRANDVVRRAARRVRRVKRRLASLAD